MFWGGELMRGVIYCQCESLKDPCHLPTLYEIISASPVFPSLGCPAFQLWDSPSARFRVF